MTNELRQQVLTALAELSAAYPDWRFGQMIANLSLIARGHSPAVGPTTRRVADCGSRFDKLTSKTRSAALFVACYLLASDFLIL